jgi:hypothetical protein
MEDEKVKRMALSKKYHRVAKIIRFADDRLQTLCIGLGITGIALLSTVVATPVSIACEGVAIGLGALSIFGNHQNKKLMLKAEKHEKIKVLSESKLNTISDHISKSLMDGFVSDSEIRINPQRASKI